jgi:hypothetical protein
MDNTARDRARSLELVIRAASAEERQLGARLARAAEEHRRARAALGDNGGAAAAPQPDEGSSER